jgi:hypothetical protein
MKVMVLGKATARPNSPRTAAERTHLLRSAAAQLAQQRELA